MFITILWVTVWKTDADVEEYSLKHYFALERRSTYFPHFKMTTTRNRNEFECTHEIDIEPELSWCLNSSPSMSVRFSVRGGCWPQAVYYQTDTNFRAPSIRITELDKWLIQLPVLEKGHLWTVYKVLGTCEWLQYSQVVVFLQPWYILPFESIFRN